MQKIEIENFRQVPKAIIDLKNIVVLIGEQGSGKSTIAKLIYFFKSLRQDFFNIVNQRSSTDVLPEYITSIQNKFAIYFGSTTRLSSNFKIVFWFSYENEECLTLSKVKSLQVKFSEKYWQRMYEETNTFLKRNQNYLSLKNDYQIQENANRIFQNNLNELCERIFNDKRNSVFVPAGRNITVSFPEQFQLFFYKSVIEYKNHRNTVDLQLVKEFISYSKFLVDYFAQDKDVQDNNTFHKYVSNTIKSILKGKYKNINGHEQLHYENNRFVPLNIASSGQQESIRIIQDLMYLYLEKESASRIIEEPEAHLFPSAQVNLMVLLSLIANYTKSQFLITTHSPFILTALNNLLYYTKTINTTIDENKEEVKKHFKVSNFDESKNEIYGLDANDFETYALSTDDGVAYCKSVFDKKLQLISDNYIDEVSESTNETFDFLYSKI